MKKSRLFLINKFKNILTKKGKSENSEKILSIVLRLLHARGYNALNVLILAVNNVKPLVQLKKKKKRGTFQTIPRPISLNVQLSKALKDFIHTGKNSNKSIAQALVDELIESSNRYGRTFKDSQLLHKQAVQNKSFAHYRWL